MCILDKTNSSTRHSGLGRARYIGSRAQSCRTFCTRESTQTIKQSLKRYAGAWVSANEPRGPARRETLTVGVCSPRPRCSRRMLPAPRRIEEDAGMNRPATSGNDDLLDEAFAVMDDGPPSPRL